MKSSTRFLICLAGLAGVIGLAAWYLRARPVPPPAAAAAPPAAPAPVAPPDDTARAAIESLRRLPAAEYTRALWQTLEALGRHDPDRALVLAREFVTTHDQRAIYNSLFAQFAAADPAAAVPRLALVPAGDSRDRARRALADGWAARDLPAALNWAQKLAPADRAPAMEAVLMAMAVDDPRRAMDTARQTLAGAALDRTLTVALESLTRTNPAEAGSIVSTLAAGEVQTRAALDVARALAAPDPAAALAWAGTLPAGNARDLAVGSILEIWAAHHPPEAGRYVGSLPAGPLQESAAGRVVMMWAATDPAGALAWAQALPAASTRNRVLALAASAWAQRDPAAAAHWAATEPALPADVLPGVLSHWLLHDAGAAKDFTGTLTGENQARAAAAIAPALAQADALAAVAWTQALSEPAARESALAAAYARWRLNDPAAARAWLAKAGMSAAVTARLQAGP